MMNAMHMRETRTENKKEKQEKLNRPKRKSSCTLKGKHHERRRNSPEATIRANRHKSNNKNNDAKYTKY